MFAEENLNDKAGAEEKDAGENKDTGNGKDAGEEKDTSKDKGELESWEIGEGDGKRTVTTEDILAADERKQEADRLKAEHADLKQRHAKLVSSVGFQQSEAGKINKEKPEATAETKDPFEGVDMEDADDAKAAIVKVYNENKKLREDIPKMVSDQALKDRAMVIISDHPVLKELPEKAAIGTYDSAMEYGNEQNNLALARGESPPYPNPKSAIEGYMKAISSGLTPEKDKETEKKPDKAVKVAQKIFKDVTTGSEETVPGGGGGEGESELVEKWESMSVEQQNKVISDMGDKKATQFQKTLNAYLDKN